MNINIHVYIYTYTYISFVLLYICDMLLGSPGRTGQRRRAGSGAAILRRDAGGAGEVAVSAWWHEAWPDTVNNKGIQ